MLSDTERQAVIERITDNISEFDDDTLQELERLTDPETHLKPESASGVDEGLSRRQVLGGVVAGGAVVALGAAGVFAVVRGGTGDEAEIDRLKKRAKLYEELEGVDIDRELADAMADYGTELQASQSTADQLEAGLILVRRVLDTPVVDLDPGVASALEDNLLGPADQAVEDLRSLQETWVAEVQEPMEARLASRAEVRARLERQGE